MAHFAGQDFQSSPVAQMATEILSMIFEEVVSDWECLVLNKMGNYNGHYVKNEHATLREYLLTLLAVSRKWRYVSIQTPRLWRNIWHGDYGYEDGTSYHLETCVTRSQSVPLNVWASDVAQTVVIFRYLDSVGALKRVRTLHLEHVPAEPISPELQASLQNHQPCIGVKELSFTGFWDDLPAETFCAVLLQCIGITSLTICETILELTVPGPIVTLPHLESLQLVLPNVSQGWVHDTLALLSAPKLANLLLIVDESDREKDEYVVEFHCQPGAYSHVRELTIGGTLRAIEILDVLLAMPNVEVLKLIKSSIQADYDEILHGLGHCTGHILIPLLHTLCYEEFPLSLGAIHDFVDRRLISRHGAHLRTIGLSEAQWSDASLTPGIEKLAEKVAVVHWAAPVIDVFYYYP